MSRTFLPGNAKSGSQTRLSLRRALALAVLFGVALRAQDAVDEPYQFGALAAVSTPSVSMQSPDGAPRDLFGLSVSNVGDVNGDEFDDIIVGCFRCDVGALEDAGKAFVFFGGDPMDATVDITLQAPNPAADERFGFSWRGGR